MSHGTCFPFFDSESQPNLAVDSESQPNLAVESWCFFSPKMRDFISLQFVCSPKGVRNGALRVPMYNTC